MKKCLSILLCLCMALTLLPVSALADYATPNGLTITGGTEGSDYTYDNSAHVLTITGNGAYTISGSSSADTIYVAPTNGGTVNITLSGVSIDASNAQSYNAFAVEPNVNLNLTLIGDNVLKSGDGAAGLEVPDGATLDITKDSTGTLTATGGSNGAGIGGDTYYNDCGAISILGGNVNAVAGDNYEAIGGASGTNSGSLTGVNGTVRNRTPTIVTLEGVNAGADVGSLTIQDSSGSFCVYGSTTTRTLEGGKLYLWLPDGTTVTGATANSIRYSGSVASGQTGTLEFPTVASVTLSNGSLWNNYPDFASALQNAQNTPGSTLTLQDDVICSSQINIGATMTLDLNGHKLEMGSSCIQINSNGDLTVNDSSGDNTGLITSSVATLAAHYGKLTVNGGTIETTAVCSDALECAGSDVVIHGGAFIGTGLDVQFSGGALTIDGGSFTKKGLWATVAGVTLKGGTFAYIEAPNELNANSLLADGFKYYSGSDTTGSVADGSVTPLFGPVTVGERDWSGDVTYDGTSQTYTVLSADGLRWVSGVSNGTITADTYQNDPQMPEKSSERGYFYGATVNLNTDIDLSGENWTPIKWFGGTFDGAGHSITGLKVDGVFEQSGFFAALSGEARNLYVSGSVNVSSSNDIYAGGIAGTVTEYGQIYNCTSGVAVTATPTASGAVYAGGLVGANGGIIQNCLLKEVTSGSFAGRVGSYCSIKNCYTPAGTNLVGTDIDSHTLYTSVGTYDASGNLAATNGTTLDYGMTLANAMQYWVGRQEEYARNYVTWTADAIPALTTAYAEDHAASYGDWVKQADGGYIRTNDYTGLTQTAEAVVTSSGAAEAPCATLEDAITAAQSASGSTVKLLTDVTTDAEVDVASGTFTIDLNSKTWTSTVTSSNALSLTGTADVTLMDSGTGGKFTSATAGGCATVRVSSASAAIKSGTYASTGSDGCALTVCDVKNENQVTITGGTYQGEVGFYSCKNVSVSGGTFTDMQAQADNEGDLHTVGGLLADGYAYRSTESGNAWINSEPAGDLLNVSVQAAPVKITGQPQGVTVTYGYTDAPTLSVTAVTVPADSGKTVSYQWYRIGTGAGGADEAMTDTAADANYTVESGLNADTYNYYCVVTCDGYTVKSDNAMVTVNKVDGAVANKTDGGYATSYTYSSNPIVSPAEANFTTNGGTGFTFTWYSGTSADDANKLLSAPTNAGTYTLKVDVAGTANVSAASVTLPVIISKANPGIGGITCSDTLYTSTVPSSVTLTRANITVPGMLALDGVTALTEGTNTYNWKFTPTDTSNYNTTAGTVSLAVTQDTLQSISASGTPNKTAYRYGDDFDMTGLTVTAAYLSGATKTVTTAVTASPLAVGDSSATLSYTDGEVTKTCTVSGITVAKKQLNVSGWSWSTTGTPFSFDGSAKSVMLAGTLPDGVAVSKSGDSFNDAGDYTAAATFSLAEGYSADHYEIIGTNPLTASWSIAKAAAPTVSEQTQCHIRTTASTGNAVGLASLLPENRGITTYTVTSTGYTALGNVSVSADGTLTYDTKASGSALTDTITVKAAMQNYSDKTITVKVSLTDKTGVTITGLTAPTNRVYNGTAVANGDFGTPVFTPDAYTGTGLAYTYYSGDTADGSPLDGAPKNAGTYTVRVAIPDSNELYEGYADVTFAIGKASVTASADNKSMTTGGTLPAFTVSYAGIATGDTADSIFATPAAAATAADGKTAGNYAISVTMPVLTSDAANNYTVGASVNGTLTVSNPSYNGGGGSGSSSGSSTDTVPISNGTDQISASVSVTGGTATVSVTDAQVKEIASDVKTAGTIKLDVSGKEAASVVVPSKLISAADGAALEVALPAGTVTLDKNALASVSGKGDISLAVETVDNSKLTDTQKAVLGAQAETAFVVDVNVYAGGTRTSTFGDGEITVSVPYTLKSGDSADSITVWFIKDDGTIEPKTASYANGRVTFTTEHLSQYLIVTFPFADVAEDAWYYGGVAYAYNNGLFAGTSDTTFSPDTAMTRQMIWMVLARMAGKTPANMDEARTWAVENGISDGSNPTDAITREQMAAVLYRCAQYKNYDVNAGEDTNILSYDDALDISEYAVPAMQWACGAGLMQGSDNNLTPSGTATRAQVATILQRFCQNMAK